MFLAPQGRQEPCRLQDGPLDSCYNLAVNVDQLPPFIERLLWDVEPGSFDLERHRSLLFERVMSRGSWEAMVWLRNRFSVEVLAEFLREQGAMRLPPRDLAYWSLVCDLDLPTTPGGGRPGWAGP